MINPITTLLFTSTGAFAIWLTKGFKGSFDKEMVSIDERNSTKGTIRYFLGLSIWISVLLAVFVILTRPPETKSYKVKTNEKGEIIEFEEMK